MEILQLLDADLLMRPRADAVASPASAPMSVPAPAALRVAEPAPQPYAGDNVPRKPADRPWPSSRRRCRRTGRTASRKGPGDGGAGRLDEWGAGGHLGGHAHGPPCVRL